MTDAVVLPRRLATIGMALLLALMVVPPTATLGAAHEPELLATLELPRGDIDYELELGTLHFFDEENAPFIIQVLDGCSVNDHLWVFGAGQSGIPMPLTVLDLNSGKSERIVLPPFEPGDPIGTIIEPEALRICDDTPVGGLPTLRGVATFTAAGGRGRDFTDSIDLLSEGRDDTYRRLVRPGASYPIITKGSPIIAIDENGAYDELILLTEGLTPRRVEGVVFSGNEGMLPGRASLEKALKDITNSRVRRALETAKKSRVPQGIIEDLGLTRVDRVHHISLELDTLGADAYLTEAGWVKQHGEPIMPPQSVEERFTVEIARADGETERLPLVGPLVGSDAEGLLWEYRSDDALVQIIDACGLTGSFWTLAGAVTDEPLELIVSDTSSGTAASYLLWSDREDVARLSDSSSLAACP